jgi:hypothetical protein
MTEFNPESTKTVYKCSCREEFSLLRYNVVEGNIRMDIKEMGVLGCGMYSSVSGQGSVVGSCECINEP